MSQSSVYKQRFPLKIIQPSEPNQIDEVDRFDRISDWSDKYKLDCGVKPRPVADDLIYNSGLTFATPLLLYRIQLGSSIHPEHVDAFHKNSHDGILNFWQQQGPNMTVEDITNFDPYFNKISNPSGNPG